MHMPQHENGRPYLRIIGPQIPQLQQVTPVAIQAVLLVDGQHMRLVLVPILLQHVHNGILVSQARVVDISRRRQLTL